ncbi:MAG: hypothetical protein GWN67_09400 [Phycisphaerae bacterium]|nr:hypothetical protein [Phycisphaerae bacterium]NIP52318.1 hypothetical protein [Phycisphaerae bacterium]NIS51281.1 hypothetical protein [Phycisphaerae bacterium]NIU09793.1 hypothetical protein [Phycisphaerae bacterium]NIU56581.1 hypothetical protein [Phycisphaerae bacterium]
MNLRKGILRVVALATWFLFCVAFAFVTFQVLGSTLTFDNIFFCMVTFIVGFYVIPVLIIIWSHSVYTPANQIWDIEELPSKIIFCLSLMAGIIGLVTCEFILPSERHARKFLGAFALPFMLISGSYILMCWILEGFRDI